MKKLYNEFFYIPKDGKIREKVILTRMALSVLVIVVCLAAMGLSAYAYFSHDIASASNIIQSANFGIKVSIENESDSTDTVVVREVNSTTQLANLRAGNTYTVTIEKLGEATGFCIISVKNCEIAEYFTQQMGDDSITFTVTLTSDADVNFSANWGTSIYYSDYIQHGTNEEFFIIDEETVEFKIKP